MTASLLSSSNSFLSACARITMASGSSSLAVPCITGPQKLNIGKQQLTLCKAVRLPPTLGCPELSRRTLSFCFLTSVVLSLNRKGGNPIANAAILEADDDEELLEKTKRDRKKRLERQGVINSSIKETGYLQDLVYRLSKVGEALDNSDLSAASSVLGGSTGADWVKNANIAFTKLSSSDEEKTEVDKFNTSLATLMSSVSSNDIESSKLAFVSSASAFEKWTSMTGVLSQLKGL